ncbi:MAG: hypothetical protein N2663_01700 [Chlorobi bacterium]|nr:hypothetical protein [Chlorobiota bacterium]
MSLSPVLAQWIRVNGSFGASADAYRAVGNTARLPSETYRAVGRLSVVLADNIEFPFELYLNSGQVGFQQPFNQFGVTPRFGWLQLFGGWYSTRVSDFTFGDLRIFGGGVELTPGAFRLAFHYGYTRQPRQPDTAVAFWGEYRRRVVIGRLGYESQDGSFFTIQAMTSQDEPGSIQRDHLTSSPQANAVLSLAGGIAAFSGAVRLRGEVAAGLFTNDIGAGADSALATNIPSAMQQLVPTNATSNIDGAGRVNLVISPSAVWGITLDGQWIGPGFVTLGYAQLLNDLLDVSASPYVRFADGRVSLRATFSRRVNNLRQTRIATIERWVANSGINWQISDALGMDLQYGQYTMMSDHTNDTLRADNRMQMLTLTPSWRFVAGGNDHFLSASLSYQSTTDNNIVSGRYGSNSMISATLSHSTQLPSKLGLSTSLSYNHTETYLQNIRFATLSESLTYPFAERWTARGTLGFNATSTARTTLQLLLRAAVTYSLSEWGSLTLQLMNNTFDLTAQQGNRYSELFGSLQYAVSF